MLVIAILNLFRIAFIGFCPRLCPMLGVPRRQRQKISSITEIIFAIVIGFALVAHSLAIAHWARHKEFPEPMDNMIMYFGLLTINLILSSLWATICWSRYQRANHGEHISNFHKHLLSITHPPQPKPPEPKMISYVLDDRMAECTKSLCIICLNDMSLDAKVGMLACGHAFHYECVETWLKSHWWTPRCPMRCSNTLHRSQNISFQSAAVMTSSSSDDVIQI